MIIKANDGKYLYLSRLSLINITMFEDTLEMINDSDAVVKYVRVITDIDLSNPLCKPMFAIAVDGNINEFSHILATTHGNFIVKPASHFDDDGAPINVICTKTSAYDAVVHEALASYLE